MSLDLRNLCDVEERRARSLALVPLLHGMEEDGEALRWPSGPVLETMRSSPGRLDDHLVLVGLGAGVGEDLRVRAVVVEELNVKDTARLVQGVAGGIHETLEERGVVDEGEGDGRASDLSAEERGQLGRGVEDWAKLTGPSCLGSPARIKLVFSSARAIGRRAGGRERISLSSRRRRASQLTFRLQSLSRPVDEDVRVRSSTNPFL